MRIKLLINFVTSITNNQYPRTMAHFTQILNPITGQNEWGTRDDDYDYHQEVANAGFGDMLHDRERNQKYYAALRKTITQMHAEGRQAHVLDIGTGTGILAMMAVEAGADTVTACEAFIPMANCAERILARNGVADKVRLVKKRSTELKVGVDMPQRANLLVTEVLDTELIGEGAIGIYNHAHEALLTDDVICIPAKASCYAQVAQSTLAAQWNSLKIVANLEGDVLLRPPKELLACKGEAGLHDVQLSQLPLEQFRPLTAPGKIFEFDFNRKQDRETERQKNLVLKSNGAGSTDLVFYWWEIEMDIAAEILLSCAPFWAHPELKQLAANRNANLPLPNVVPWRDHWMQAIYYIPKPLQLGNVDAEFTLNCNHDEYSLWFDAFLTKDSPKQPVQRHSCTCSLHMTYGRSRIGQMNQSTRNKRYLSYLEESISKESHVLSLGDGCIMGLATAAMGATRVVYHEPHRFSRRFLELLILNNDLVDKVQCIDKLESLEEPAQFTHVFAEPYFLTSILPWDNFYFGTLLAKIQTQLSASVKIAPHSARIYAVPVEFLDLHKIRTPLGSCEGFDLTLFDKMVDISATVAQTKVEAQPLWEYPCRALAQPQEILEVVFRNFMVDKKNEGVVSIQDPGSCNGIALWVDWQIDDSKSPKSVVSTGPTEAIVAGEYIKWDMFVRQGVHLIGKAQNLHANKSEVHWKVEFKPQAGDIKFNFEVKA